MNPLLHLDFQSVGAGAISAKRTKLTQVGLAAFLAGSLTLAGCGNDAESWSKIGAATYRGPATSTGSSAKAAGQGSAASQNATAGKSKKALTAPVVPSTLASGAEAVGNAFYINNKGQLLTTWEQIRSCRRVAIMDSFELRHVRVIAGNPLSGLAVLDAGETAAIYALFRATPAAVGESVTTAAHPILDGVFMPLELSKGAMQSPMAPGEANTVLRTTAFREGQSAGGPIIDAGGNVVGITVGRLSPEWPSDVGYGINTEMILRFTASVGVGVWTEEMGGQGDATALQGAAPFVGDYTVPVICFR